MNTEKQQVFILQETITHEGFGHLLGDAPTYEIIRGVFLRREDAEEAMEKEDRGGYSQGFTISKWPVGSK